MDQRVVRIKTSKRMYEISKVSLFKVASRQILEVGNWETGKCQLPGTRILWHFRRYVPPGFLKVGLIPWV